MCQTTAMRKHGLVFIGWHFMYFNWVQSMFVFKRFVFTILTSRQVSFKNTGKFIIFLFELIHKKTKVFLNSADLYGWVWSRRFKIMWIWKKQYLVISFNCKGYLCRDGRLLSRADGMNFSLKLYQHKETWTSWLNDFKKIALSSNMK